MDMETGGAQNSEPGKVPLAFALCTGWAENSEVCAPLRGCWGPWEGWRMGVGMKKP